MPGWLCNRFSCSARIQLRLRQREMEAAWPLEADIDACLRFQARSEPTPRFRRADSPTGIFGHAQTLALHPDQGKIGAGGAHGGIALVEHGHALAGPGAGPAKR